MAFQFLCPQGHLLQGDESQTGQRCQCPYCQSEFVVPQASRDPRPDHLPVARAETGPQPPAGEKPADAAPEPPSVQDTLPVVYTGSKVGGDPAEVAAQLGFATARQQGLLHIPCPKGHLLETPSDLLGQDAMCPYCQAQFRLRFEDSQECRRERDERQHRRQQKLGRAWMHWAIAIAVVVVLGVIGLIVVTFSG